MGKRVELEPIATPEYFTDVHWWQVEVTYLFQGTEEQRDALMHTEMMSKVGIDRSASSCLLDPTLAEAGEGTES